MDRVERTIASVAYWEERRAEEQEEWETLCGTSAEDAARAHARAHGSDDSAQR